MSQNEQTRGLPQAESNSISSQDPRQEDGKKVKNRRPANTAFRQQRLKAWQPILTPKTVLPLFFAVGIIFAPIGGLLLWASAKVEDISIDYTACNTSAPLAPDWGDIPSSKVVSHFAPSDYRGNPAQWQREPVNYTVPGAPGVSYNTTICRLQFEILNDIGPSVLLYYRLTEFYQNHRRYVKSFDQDQLMGKAQSNDSINGGDCDPLRLDKATGKAYYPCGLIANSLFNDTFGSPVLLNTNTTYNMSNTDIAWSSDKALYKQTSYTIDQVVPPPNWRLRYPNGYNDAEGEGLPDLHNLEEFQVWMRTAGLPTFSKLALRNNDKHMTAGRYQMDIIDNFPTQVYGGTKSILISTHTVMGGKNPFLGIAYIVVGGLCILLGALFLIAWVVKPRKLGDHTYLTWDKDQPSTAVTTGRSGGGRDSA